MAPLGALSLNLDAMAELLASCPAFQSWVGAANETAALAFVYKGEVSGAEPLPLAVVDHADNGFSFTRKAAFQSPRFSGRFTLALVGAAAFAEGDWEAYEAERETFYNMVGVVVDQLMERSARLVTLPSARVPALQGGELITIRLTNDERRQVRGNDPDAARDREWMAVLSFDWGVA